ncbi:MAG: hypothetical protein HOM68_05205 [Gemmatimonadetes bacterium]|nr:hypothetical protein [Gemmatimonadota bacterium]MBT5143144.1 hypothetical protein [Gemmatimonadota bacterium]MBT5588444.1 hypothetical protein [Gemmatimonadota bacterium]MBT7455844.1 hypothetical protein [Gemmatimonadota bacterium]MBT7599259.1 hypothetical protein [Gemmatimonadota bacterium]
MRRFDFDPRAEHVLMTENLDFFWQLPSVASYGPLAMVFTFLARGLQEW